MVKDCPLGYIKRKAYTKKSGTHVPASCIISRSSFGVKRSEINKKIMSKKSKMHKKASKKFGRPKCGKGEIVREGYHRKAYSRKSLSRTKNVHVESTWVPPVCVKSRLGRSHKGKQVIGPLVKGDLSRFGYKNIKEKGAQERRHALSKALQYEKPLPLFRKLIALGTLTKNTDPKASDIFRSDAYWVQSTSRYKNRE